MTDLSDDQIRNPDKLKADPKWLNEFRAAYAETVSLLGELNVFGYKHKKLAFVIFEDCQYPGWLGLNEIEGDVNIDPRKHEARAIAHEMGHSFHELWRQNTSHKCCGEAMAEAIRFFVENHMGDKDWTPDPKWTEVLDACDYCYDTFKSELSGKIAKLGAP